MEYYLVDVSVSCGSLSVVVDRVRVLCNTIFFTLTFYSTARLSCRRRHNSGYRPNATFHEHNLLTRTSAVQSRKCLVMANQAYRFLSNRSLLLQFHGCCCCFRIQSVFITVVIRLLLTVQNLLWITLM